VEDLVCLVFRILFLFQNELCMFLGQSCLSLLIPSSIYYIDDTCNLLQAVVHPLFGSGIRSIFFQEENFDILAFSVYHNGNCHELPYSSYEPVILEKD
jgi:hypothetical protein